MTSPFAPECCVITPVEDCERYERCLLRNPATAGCLHVMLDTAPGDPTLAARCNSFLDAYNYDRPTWFLFCPESFEPKDSVRDALIAANRLHVYHAPVRPFFSPFSVTANAGTLFIHTELLARSTLRFDETLPFRHSLDALRQQAATLGVCVERLPVRAVDYSCRDADPELRRDRPASSCRYIRRAPEGMQWLTKMMWEIRES